MPTVSIIILNWNGAHFLKQYLPLLLKYTPYPEVEIIVADNASTDDSLQILKHFNEIKVIQFEKNYGFAEGYNKSLELVNTKYCVILNSDIEVTENWLPPLIHFLNSNVDVAAVMPKIKAIFNRQYFEYAGAAGGYIDVLGYPFCRGRIFETIECDNNQYDKPREVFWVTGACMVIKTDVFKNLGGFDPLFFAHMEEIDLCWRIKNAGYKLYCVPTSTVFHFGGGALPYSNPFKTYLNFRNNLFLLYKNLPTKNLIKVIGLRIIYDYIALMFFLMQGKVSYAFSILKAHRDFFKNIKNLYSAKKLFKNQSPLKKFKSCVLNKNIVIQYYFFNKKYFSEIEKYFK